MAKYVDVDCEVDKYVTVWDCNCSEYGRQEVMAVDDLKYLPTADVIEVVRCKDCKHAYINSFSAQSGIALCKLFTNRTETQTLMQQDDYCSHGERKGEE